MAASAQAPAGKLRSLIGGQIAEIDGLRGIAILMVLVHHFWPDTGPLARLYNVAHLGWMGVDLFFVVSGFLIGGILLDTAGERHYFRNFYARRSLRIFPLYYAFLIVVFTLVPLVEGGSYSQTAFVAQSGSPWWYFLYFGNIREAFRGIEPPYYLAPLWSLCIEEQFYVSFPWIVSRVSRANLKKLVLGLIIFAPVMRTATLLLFPNKERMQYVATFSRVDVIAYGVLLALLFRTEAIEKLRPYAGKLAVVGVVLMALVFPFGGWYRPSVFCRTAGYSLAAVTFFAIVMWTVLHRNARAAAPLRFAPLTYLGKICYGLYLLHRPAESILLKTLAHFGMVVNEDAAWLVPVKIAMAIAVATASWYCFERPILRLKRRFEFKQHPGEAILEAAAPPPALSASAS